MGRNTLLELREVGSDTPDMTLGDELREARERLGLSQPEVARRVGVTQDTVSNWERDKHQPKSRLAKVRQVLHLDTAATPTEAPTGADSVEGLLDDPQRVSDLALLNALGRRLMRSAPAIPPIPAATGQYRAPIAEAPSVGAVEDPPLSEPETREA